MKKAKKMDLFPKALLFSVWVFAMLQMAACGGGSTGSGPKEVTTPTLQSIAITAAASSIAAGTTDQFTAIGTYSDSSTADLTVSVTWTSSSTAAATITSAGLATGLAVGMTNITASSGSASSTPVSLSVTAPTLQSIGVTPNTETLAPGQTQQLTATGTYSDSSTKNLTSTATWTSGSYGVSVTTSGLARGLLPGLTTVSATNQGVTGMGTVDVTKPAPRFAYAPSTDGSISVYAVSASGGRLSSLGYVLEQEAISSISIESSNTYLYAAGTGGLYVFQLSANGALVLVPGSPFDSGVSATQILADPASSLIFALTSTGIQPYTLDLSTGVPTPGAPIPATGLVQLVVDPLGRFLYALQVSNGTSTFLSFTIASDGTLTPITGSPFPAGGTSFGSQTLAIELTGRFLYQVGFHNSAGGVLTFSIDQQTGALSGGTSPIPAGGSPSALAISPNDSDLVVYDSSKLPGGQVWAFAINLSTGSLSQSQGSPFAVAGGTNFNFAPLSFDPSGQFLFVANNETIETFSDTGAGSLTQSGETIAKEAVAPTVVGGTAGVAFSPQRAYVTNQGMNLGPVGSLGDDVIDSSSGAFTQVSSLPLPTNYALSTSIIPGSAILTDGANNQIIQTFLNEDGSLGNAYTRFPSLGVLPAGTVVDPSGRFLYVVDASTNNLEAYQVPATVGSSLLPALFPFPLPYGRVNTNVKALAGTIPATLTIDPSGQYLFVVNQLAQSLNVLLINSNSGGLSSFTNFSFLQPPPSAVPVGIAVDPLGDVIIADGSGNALIYQFNPAAMTLTGPTVIPLSTSPSGGYITSVAVEPTTHAIYFSYSYPPGNGAGGILGYVLSTSNSVAMLTPISGSPFLANGQPSSVTVAGLLAYVTNFATNDVSVFSIDPNSGALTQSGTNQSLGTGPVGPSQIIITGTYK